MTMPMLNKEDIPKVILEEIESNFDNIRFDCYGDPVEPDVVTRKCKTYVEAYDEELLHTFLVRLAERDGEVFIYQVKESGMIKKREMK